MDHAQAVVLNNKVYIGGEYTGNNTTAANVYTYDPTMDTWETLQSPTRYSALTTYHNKLLLVGGLETSTGQVTNQLWVFEEGEQTWTQPLSPMSTCRWGASAVSYQDYLIVAGGYNSSDGSLNTVKVFDGQQWVAADPLPESCSFMQSTSHDGHYYLMGGDNQGTSVFYTSLQSLVEKATHHPLTSPSNTDQLSCLEDTHRYPTSALQHYHIWRGTGGCWWLPQSILPTPLLPSHPVMAASWGDAPGSKRHLHYHTAYWRDDGHRRRSD